MDEFFVLSIGGFDQRRYAWYEPLTGHHGEPPRCRVCERPVGSKHWEPPHQVELKQPRRIGDFLGGTGGFDWAVSERFLEAYRHEGLSGIEAFHPLEIVRMGTTRKARTYAKPVLHGVLVQHGPSRLDYERSGVEWWAPPEPDYCRACGPGGGGAGGIALRLGPLVLEPGTWGGEDFFFPINLAGTVLVSERAARFIERERFENATLTNARVWRAHMFEPSQRSDPSMESTPPPPTRH
jgi:hypothetical protein